MKEILLSQEQRETYSPTLITLSRVSKYVFVKGITLFITVVIGIYITILVINYGGAIDDMFRGMIAEGVGLSMAGAPYNTMPPAERQAAAEQMIREMEHARGLDQPFVPRSLLTLRRSLTLDFGEGVRHVIQNALPYTAFLVGVSNMAVFLLSISIALVLAYKPGNLVDRLMTGLSPLTFAPAWVHGVILLTVLASWLKILDWPPGRFTHTYRIFTLALPFKPNLQNLQRMILPALAICISAFFQGVYAWRSFFLAYTQEDYVVLAKAKGLTPAAIERKYILRPVLPYIVTNFAILSLALWQEAMPLEMLFKWEGIGALFVYSLQFMNITFMVATVVVFAYMLAITVFLLDIFYAFLDPRVRVGDESSVLRRKQIRRPIRQRLVIFLKGIVQRLPGSSEKAVYDLWSGDSSQKNWSDQAVRKFGHRSEKPGAAFRRFTANFFEKMDILSVLLRQVIRYPSGVAGLVGILLLVFIAVFTLVNIPYEQASRFWRGQGEQNFRSYWYQNPANVPPIWIDWFTTKKIPQTIIVDSRKLGSDKQVKNVTEEMTEIMIPLSFDYPYDDYPKEINLYFETSASRKAPLVTMIWHTPDGRQVDLDSFTVNSHITYYLSNEEKLLRRLDARSVPAGLFSAPGVESNKIVKGTYQLEVKAFTFEPDTTVDVEIILYGQVHGWLGTDPSRRDPMLALMWGTVFTLAFGLAGAVGTSILSVLLAAVGVWFSGWVDGIIQRLTEINLILPRLALAIMVYILYSKSIWVVLGVLVLFGIFGTGLKSYRAFFLQIKQSSYIEAAHAYGTSDWRIIRRYLLPGILPILIPQMVMLIPGYVFYEATLAYLSVTDPFIPTWGKVIYEGLERNAFEYGYWYQVLIPIGLLALTGLAFASLGNALERVLHRRS
ncbi:MAG: ABC transporter permease subunit [Chloroflexi bacterium]|nr:MAG: ABC transporter permease subunit [Chloroflexota bacterium]